MDTPPPPGDAEPQPTTPGDAPLPVPVAADTAKPAPPVLTADWLCANCLYNLRGLPEEGHCPECGFSVLESVTRTRALIGPQATAPDILLAARLTVISLLRCGRSTSAAAVT